MGLNTRPSSLKLARRQKNKPGEKTPSGKREQANREACYFPMGFPQFLPGLPGKDSARAHSV
jgi:hypothetical protein